MKICRENREEIENEYMALLLNNDEALKNVHILPKYLFVEKNRKLMQQIMECYQKYQFTDLNTLVVLHPDFDIDHWVFLRDKELYYKKAWRKQLKMSEESIVKFYKEDIIIDLNTKYNNGQLSYETFISKLKKLDEIKIINDANVITMDELLENINEQKQIKFNKFKRMSSVLKLAQNDLLVIGSMTGTGKTGFMLNLMCDLMNDYQCIYFNMEMSKSTIYKRLIAINGNVPVDCVNNPQTDYQKQFIKSSMVAIEKAGIIIEHRINNISQIKSVISHNKQSDKHTIVFIDHLGLTKIDGKNSLYEQMTEIMKALRQICLDYDCTIIGASQLNRNAYTSDELNLSMLKDSGELENSARKIILIYRDKSSDKEDLNPLMNINICKNDSGATGKVQMIYHKIKQIFEEKGSD